MARANAKDIEPLEPEMDSERVLDLLGRPFNGKYTEGAAEWLKNSYDHAIRTGEPDEPVIIFRISTPRRKSARHWRMECLDFFGTTYDEINSHLRIWGSEVASSRGDVNWSGFGGHGNGGKFHMRQNFLTSEFITYRDGRLTWFGFDEQQRYGFHPDYRGSEVPPPDALRAAEIDSAELHIPPEQRARLASNDPQMCRFTVVRGRGFRHARRWRRRDTFDDYLRADAQAKQVLDRARVIYVSDTEVVDPLKTPTIPPREGYEGGREYDMPGALTYDGEAFEISPGPVAGTLQLRVAADPFTRRDPSHAIDIIGRNGLIIATYKVSELPLHNRVGADFIYGALDSAALEEHGLKQNDRQRLVPNDISDAVLEWVTSAVDELSDELAKEENARRREADTEATQALTSRLNQWKNRFLRAREIMVDSGPGAGAGTGGTGDGDAGGGESGGGGEGEPGPETPPPAINGEAKGSGTGTTGGSGDERRRGARFPEIRVSGFDEDPYTHDVFPLSPRQPVVYQRTEDVENNLWWVNAQRPLAERIITEDGANSARWRDYVFNRFVEVIQSYDLRENWDQQSDISDYMWRLLGEIHDSAAVDLHDVLFDIDEEIGGDVEEPE